MARFLLGVLTGAALVALAWWLAAPGDGAEELLARSDRAPIAEGVEAEDAHPVLLAAPRASAPEAGESEGSARRTRAAGADAVAHKGLAVRAGDGVDLVGWRVVARADPQADLECLEIHTGGANVQARHGAQPLLLTGSSLFRSLRREEARRLAPHAPTSLARRDPVFVALAPHVRQHESGLLYVASGDGGAWALWIEALDDAPSVVDRVVWLLAERVEQREGGGLLADVDLLEPSPGPGQERVEQITAWGAALPGFPASSGKVFAGSWQRLKTPAGTGEVQGFHKRIEFVAPWSGPLESGAWLGLHLRGGTTVDARLALEHHSTVLVAGDLEGEVVVDDHATLVVEGDLLGRVEVKSHGILIVEGRQRGHVTVGSWARVLLRRGPGGSLDLKAGSHAHLLLAGELRREEIAGLGVPGDHATLYLESSDLAVGTHDDLAGWKQVIVGDERWAALRR